MQVPGVLPQATRRGEGEDRTQHCWSAEQSSGPSQATVVLGAHSVAEVQPRLSSDSLLRQQICPGLHSEPKHMTRGEPLTAPPSPRPPPVPPDPPGAQQSLS